MNCERSVNSINSITTTTERLPDNLNDLSAFVLVGREKLVAVRAEIRAIDRIQVARGVRDQKMEEARMLSEALLDAEVKLGEMTKQIPKAPGKRTDLKPADSGVARFSENQQSATDCGATSRPKHEVIRDLGFSPKQVERMETLADNQDLVEEVKARARENDDIPTRTEVLNLARYRKQKANELIRNTKVADEFLTVLKQVLKLDTSAESLDALAAVADASYFTVLESAANKIEHILYGLRARKEL